MKKLLLKISERWKSETPKLWKRVRNIATTIGVISTAILTAVCTYKIIGWFISGMLLYSIAENGYKITKWGPFKHIQKQIEKEIKK